jgi:uncharacterized protein (DUF488 family)
MKLMTIGFTKTTAENFFNRLTQAGVKRVVDIRLNNTSQLAGFAKGNDLRFFLRAIGDISYTHQPLLAPTQDILDAYKKEKGDWDLYERRFIALMEARQVETRIDPSVLEESCLLCSEDKPHHCHRRLVAEYLSRKWSVPVQIQHL